MRKLNQGQIGEGDSVGLGRREKMCKIDVLESGRANLPGNFNWIEAADWVSTWDMWFINVNWNCLH